MMKTFLTYLLLQVKRVGKLIPHILTVTLLLSLCVALFGWMLSGINKTDDAKQKIRIGVVGNMDNAYLRIGIYALERIDSTRYTMSLEMMDEQEAHDRLTGGKLSAYLVIPDGFVESMWNGERKPITYVTTNGATGIGTILMNEIADMMSVLLLETENAIYGVQAYTADHLESTDPYEAGDRLSLRYAESVLDRESLFDVYIVEGSDSFELTVYCGISVLFLLLWGIGCSPLFSKRSVELGRLLRAGRLGSLRQILAEYAAFALLMICITVGLGLVSLTILQNIAGLIPELDDLWTQEIFLIGLRLIPVGMMIAAMQFMLYELVPGSVGGILLQFLNAAVQGFLAGCLYPPTFLPIGVRRFGELLPAGVAVKYMRNCLLFADSFGMAAAVAGYTLIFLAITAVIRTRRSKV